MGKIFRYSLLGVSKFLAVCFGVDTESLALQGKVDLERAD